MKINNRFSLWAGKRGGDELSLLFNLWGTKTIETSAFVRAFVQKKKKEKRKKMHNTVKSVRNGGDVRIKMQNRKTPDGG
jgi:hypothetical protein